MAEKSRWWQRILDWVYQCISYEKHQEPVAYKTHQGPEFYPNNVHRNNHNRRFKK